MWVNGLAAQAEADAARFDAARARLMMPFPRNDPGWESE